MSTSKWRLLDVSQLDNTHCYLPDQQRRELYDRLTETFTIKSSGNDDNPCFKVDGLSSANIGSIMTPQSLKHQIQTIIYYFCIMGFFFVPVISLIYILYLFYYGYYTQFIMYSSIYLILAFYPISENKGILRNKYVYNQLKYFSYKLCCHQDTHQYMLDKHENLIFMSIPHGALPLTTIIAPLIQTDLYHGNEPVGTTASVIFMIPIIRNFAYWFGAKSVSKSNIKHILLKVKKCVNIVSDGISGIFIEHNDSKEIALIKNRKGIAKLALQCGCVGVVPCYGFGNAQVFKCWFDPYGILRKLSKLLRVSLIILYGRFYLWIPNRIPLYNVIGPIVKNKYMNKPIPKPTQTQIDEYHEEILRATKLLFDQHKAIYGWKDKELVIV